ncbi:DEKNAAC105550 [Brettanomyces naardenensis]|uniref:DEKNAAC105550 n=1 Tax=Brettanomyces naardenensis TaxID=13370 RepID=A0A448YTW2_BRENA|nr:DEKNAAC105550 [Brettanomyces naardenensis]
MLDESGQADDELNDVLLQVSSDGENSAMKVALNGRSVTGVKRAPQRRGSDSDHKARRLG